VRASVIIIKIQRTLVIHELALTVDCCQGKLATKVKQSHTLESEEGIEGY
jgi:hypothetical protein